MLCKKASAKGGKPMFHILVADDDKNTRRLMQAVLEAQVESVAQM